MRRGKGEREVGGERRAYTFEAAVAVLRIEHLIGVEATRLKSALCLLQDDSININKRVKRGRVTRIEVKEEHTQQKIHLTRNSRHCSRHLSHTTCLG